MKVFVTGATGFIGSRVVPELMVAGHQVIGLTRSDEGAEKLKAAGAEVHRGTLEDVATLRSGAAKADAVIHLAYDHNFTDMAAIVANSEKDKQAILAMGEELAGSKRPMVITSGVGLGSFAPGEPASEDHFDKDHQNPRKNTELAGMVAAEKGASVIVVRLPQVHDPHKQGLITYLVAIARQKGVSAYLGDGQRRWAAAPVGDTARLYRLALEKNEPGARYNAVAEEGVAAKPIAEVIGRGLKVPVKSLTPEEAQAHFGWFAMFAALDLPASSKLTRQRLGWEPTGPTLLEDLGELKFV